MGFKVERLKPTLALRIGLGFIFIYAGVMSFSAPENWIGFVPPWIENIIKPLIFLQVHAAFEIILGLTLLTGIVLPAAALIAFFNIFAILFFYGVDDVTFRDFGLLMTALALFLLSTKERTAIKERAGQKSQMLPNRDG